jgi:carbamoyl-phosphate synthase large subunit
MHPQPFSVLISSVSRKVGLIQAARTAARRLHPEATVVGVDGRSDVIGRYFVDAFWQLANLEGLPLDDLLRRVHGAGVRLIIPTRDGELASWATRKPALEAAGISVMVADAEAVALALDKLAFHNHLQAMGISVIPTSSSVMDFASDQSLVVKERSGSGSRGVALRVDRVAAMAHASGLRRPLFQPFIEGLEFTVDLFLARDGRVMGAVPRRRELVVDGESQITTVVPHEAAAQLAVRVARAVGLTGHVVVQILQSASGQLHVVECNARFGGASTLSVSYGLDSFYWTLREVLGLGLDEEVFKPHESIRTQVRYPADLLL